MEAKNEKVGKKSGFNYLTYEKVKEILIKRKKVRFMDFINSYGVTYRSLLNILDVMDKEKLVEIYIIGSGGKKGTNAENTRYSVKMIEWVGKNEL